MCAVVLEKDQASEEGCGATREHLRWGEGLILS